MTNVTVSEVQGLIPDCSTNTAVTSAIIIDATVHINNLFIDCSITDEEKKTITKWFSAHMLASGPERQAKREKLGDAEVEYNGISGTDLTSTTYGQMVLSLDRWGRFVSVGKKAVVITAVTSFEV